MRTMTGSVLMFLALSVVLTGCKKKPKPILPPPTAEAVAAFTEAAYNGDTLKVADALKAGMPVNQVETYGNSALMLASFNGHIETMTVLLDAGADINQRDMTERTALMFAASGPFPAAVTLLLERGADINAIDKTEHFSALMFAAAEGLSPVVDILLAKGADPKLQDKDGDTAASFAQKRGFTELSQTLQRLIDAP